MCLQGPLQTHVNISRILRFPLQLTGEIDLAILADFYNIQELLGAMMRRRHPEMFLKDVMKRRLKGSQFDMRFHVRDLVGSGAVEELQTTAGPLLRVIKNRA